MQVYKCDGCGQQLRRHALRYTVNIEVKAAYDQMEVGLFDLVRDHRAELQRLVRDLDERETREVEEEIYKKFRLDLCPKCQKAYLRDPLRFHPEQAGDEEPPADIDGFLRSLGYGGRAEEAE